MLCGPCLAWPQPLTQCADSAEGRVTELDGSCRSLQLTLDTERGTMLATLRTYQDRDTEMRGRVEQLEAEVLRMAERLK